MGPDGLILLPHEEGVVNLLDAGSEMPMPKKRCFFKKRGAGVAHSVEPPETQVSDCIMIRLGHGLSDLPSFLLRFCSLVAFLIIHALRGQGQGRHREEVAVLGGLKEGSDRRRGSHRVQGINLCGSAPESGTIEQVRRRVAVPKVFRKRHEHPNSKTR